MHAILDNLSAVSSAGIWLVANRLLNMSVAEEGFTLVPKVVVLNLIILIGFNGPVTCFIIPPYFGYILVQYPNEKFLLTPLRKAVIRL